MKIVEKEAQIAQIIKDVMEGKTVELVVISNQDNELGSLTGSLKAMNPKLKANCNSFILQNNVTRLSIDLTLVTREDWIEASLRNALIGTTLNITTA